MFEYIRKFSNKPAGKAVVIGFVAILVLLCAYVIKGTIWSSTASAANGRVFIDSETNQTFSHTLAAGDKIPIASPSGKMNGYPAEQCYWTKDGKTKTDPTYVMLKSYTGSNEPTFCPDCGRLVVYNNPAPAPGAKPPLTKEEYEARMNR